MFKKGKPKVYKPSYYLAVALREGLDRLKEEIPSGMLDKRLQQQIRTIEGILSNMLLSFSQL